jgi:hypothetical protein
MTSCLRTISITANARDTIPESEKPMTVPSTLSVMTIAGNTSSGPGKNTSDIAKLTLSPLRVPAFLGSDPVCTPSASFNLLNCGLSSKRVRKRLQIAAATSGGDEAPSVSEGEALV